MVLENINFYTMKLIYMIPYNQQEMVLLETLTNLLITVTITMTRMTLTPIVRLIAPFKLLLVKCFILLMMNLDHRPLLL